jgi:hypothetical protein
MRNGVFPIFTKGRVIKKESIEYLRDFPYDLASLAFDNYCDGVLFGFGLKSKDEKVIQVSQGAVKFQGNIIVISECEMDITEFSRFSYAKLAIGSCKETVDFKSCPIDIRLDSSEFLHKNEMELGRFCLNKGAILRCKYDSFGDLRTEENTLDLTRVPYACMGATPTLHPRVLQEYSRALLPVAEDATDIAFALMCLNAGGGVVHKSSIQWYIALRNHEEYKEYLLTQLYDRLMDMLPGHKGVKQRKRERWPTIG